ncbi:hypothetical protein V6N11_012296 [Hibiscus sabdariffa]|uniref:Uncharacterized protein n=1 Tax=Hibiscus sabdariffa TaxID=183260 RepID=A0ABR2QAS1_9ROSI
MDTFSINSNLYLAFWVSSPAIVDGTTNFINSPTIPLHKSQGSDVSRESEVNSDDRPLHRRNSNLSVSTMVALPSPVHHVISNVGAMRHIRLSVPKQRNPPSIYTLPKMGWLAGEGIASEGVGGCSKPTLDELREKAVSEHCSHGLDEEGHERTVFILLRFVHT